MIIIIDIIICLTISTMKFISIIVEYVWCQCLNNYKKLKKKKNHLHVLYVKGFLCIFVVNKLWNEETKKKMSYNKLTIIQNNQCNRKWFIVINQQNKLFKHAKTKTKIKQTI